MPERSDLTQPESPEEPGREAGWGFGPAGWTFTFKGPSSAAGAEVDPEAEALRLWTEGRKDEAIAFLRGRIARERSAAPDEHPEEPAVAPGTALAVIPPRSDAGVTVLTPSAGAASDADDSRFAGKLIHLAPEPRVGDARDFRPAAARALKRPSLLLAAALVVGSVGVGTAIWPDGEPASVEVAGAGAPVAPVDLAAVAPAEEQAPMAAAPADAPTEQADASSLELSPDEGVPLEPFEPETPVAPMADLPDEVPPEEMTPEAAVPLEPYEPDAPVAPSAAEVPRFVANAPRPEIAERASPAETDVPPAELDEVPAATVTANAEPASAPVPRDLAGAESPSVAATPATPVRTARLPRPRPHLAAPPVIRQTDPEPEELAVVEIPPPGPDDRYLPGDPGEERREGPGYGGFPSEPDGFEPEYGYLPPALAERRAAAARYAAARRAAERRVEYDEERWEADEEWEEREEDEDGWNGPVILRGAPLYTIQGPVILRGAPRY